MMQERNIPLTARSVLASTLLGADPPLLPVSYLVHEASLFGINENRARVALSRKVSSGAATTDGGGHYRLAGHLLHRQARQQASRQGLTKLWTGTWRTVVIVAPGSSAEVRAARRRALALARLAELRAAAGRPGRTEVTLCGHLQHPSDIVRYAEAGVDRVFVKPWERTSGALEGIRRFADQFGLS